MFEEKEKLIKEKRLGEATVKNLLGLEGKFGKILRHFGQSIINQSASSYEASYLPDYYEVPDEEKIPEIDEDEVIVEIGKIFDGLRHGYHLEITYLITEKELKVMFKGYLVYKEVDSELECYKPEKEWENIIDHLYKITQKKDKDNKKLILEEKKEILKKEKLSFIDNLRMRWGI